ncbi:RDD family protein, partial [Aequorivita sp. SDUM287046]
CPFGKSTDFAKLVYIWRGSCQNTPQLIYINVTIHLKKTARMNKPFKTEPNIGKRFLAGFLDYLLIYAFVLTFIFAFGEPNVDGEYSVTGFSALIPISFWLIMTVGLEIGIGATIGNSVVGLKAIPKNGTNRKLTFGESFKRHLLDPIDMFFFGLVGVMTIKNTELNQRIGDLWAETIVVPTKSLPELKTE